MKQNKSVFFTYFLSSFTNAIENNALEDYFLSMLDENTVFLLLYSNTPSVILGRNQNPYRETNPDFLNCNSIVLSRRLSGGGAVYHDLGVFNYAFLYSESVLNKDNIFFIVSSVFNSFNISVSINQRGSIEAKGNKISGTAYGFRKNKVLHHGSILFSADLSMLKKSLSPYSEALQDTSVASVRSNVINCNDIRTITTDDFKNSFLTKTKELIVNRFNAVASDESLNEELHLISINTAYADILLKYNDKAWIFGKYGKDNTMNLMHDYVQG